MHGWSTVSHVPVSQGAALFLWTRLRVQIGGACLFQAIPYCVGVIVHGDVSSTNTLVTMAAVFLCTIVAGGFYRNLSRHPGIEASAYVLPCVVLPFAVMVFLLMLVQPGFSRLIFFSSLAVNIVWYYAVFFMIQRQRDIVVGTLPFGNVERPEGIPGVRYVTLDQPQPVSTVDAVVVDLSDPLPGPWEGALAEYALSGVPVYDMRQFNESLSGRVRIDHISHNHFGALAPLTSYLRLRRIFDKIAAVLTLVILSPLLAVVAAIIRMETPGPAIFRQERIGYRGQTFSVLKFRTMRCKTEPSADTRLQAITQKDDLRITPFGRFLRRTRIDELPQIVNIIRGEMSWIGPRPEAVVLSTWYQQEIAFYRYRHIVPPGITGWAQVNQGHVSDVDAVRQKLQYDFYYVKHFSLWLDIHIIMRTIKIVFTGAGSK